MFGIGRTGEEEILARRSAERNRLADLHPALLVDRGHEIEAGEPVRGPWLAAARSNGSKLRSLDGAHDHDERQQVTRNDRSRQGS